MQMSALEPMGITAKPYIQVSSKPSACNYTRTSACVIYISLLAASHNRAMQRDLTSGLVLWREAKARLNDFMHTHLETSDN